MNRRHFLEASTSLLAAIGLPKTSELGWVLELNDRGEVHGQYFELVRPFIVKDEWSDVVFVNCIFRAAPWFVGNKLVDGVISCYCCVFDVYHCNCSEPIILRVPPQFRAQLQQSQPYWEYGNDLEL